MEKSNKRLIFICIPNMGNICSRLTERLIYWSRNEIFNVQFFFPTGMLPLDNARSHCVSKFMEISNHEDDRLWFIDADIIPPLNGLEVLMNHDKDVIGSLCFMMKPDNSGQMTPLPIAIKYNEEKKYKVFFDGKGVTEVDALGGGCIMVKRKVFEKIGGRPYEFHYYPDGTLKLVGDYDFCQKVQKAGMKIYVDFNNICGHIKSVDLLEINNLMLKVQNGK